MGMFDGIGAAVGNIANTTQNVGRSTGNSARRRRRNNNGGGGSGGGGSSHRRSGGGGNSSRQPTASYSAPPRPAVGSTSKGTVAPSVPAPTVKPMSLDQWLAQDTAFTSAKNNYSKALQDFTAQDAAERAKFNNEYNVNVQKLGVEKGDAQTALNDDYAARGLMNSGLYADALNDFQKNYAQKQADLDRAKTAYLNDLSTDKTNFTSQQALELQKAKDAAAARRTAQFGL